MKMNGGVIVMSVDNEKNNIVKFSKMFKKQIKENGYEETIILIAWNIQKIQNFLIEKQEFKN